MKRVFSLLGTVLEAYLKADSIEAEVLLYLVEQLEEFKMEAPSLCISILSELHDLLVKCCSRKASTKKSLSAISKPFAEDPEVQQRTSQVKEFLRRCLPITLHFVTSDEESVREELHHKAAKVHRLLLCCLSYTRSCISLGSAGWQDLLSPCLRVWHLLSEDMLERLAGLAAEAWFFTAEPFPTLRPLIESVSPASHTSLLCKAFTGVSLGTVFAVKDQLSSLFRSWTEFNASCSDPIAVIGGKQGSSDPANILAFEEETEEVSKAVRYTIGLFVSLIGLAQIGFRGISEALLSSSTYLAMKMMSKMRLTLGDVRNDLGTQLALCRVQALFTTHQISAAQQEARSILPRVFSLNAEDTGSDKLEFLPDEVPDSVSCQRLCLMVLSSMKMFSKGMQHIDHLMSKTPMQAWLIAERAWLQFLAVVDAVMNQNSGLKLLRDIDLASLKQVHEICGTITTLRELASQDDVILKDLSSRIQLRLGICCWVHGGTMRADKLLCHAFLLNAAKLDADETSVYSFLGHYYWKHLNDRERGVKFYIKALSLDPLNAEAGVSCSNLYLESNQTEKAVKLWNDISTLSPQALWMHIARGHHHLSIGEGKQAIVSFQKASELNPEDIALWMGLGYSYMIESQYAAAYKAFQRSYELDGNNLVVLCALADAERRLGQIPNASKHYAEVLELEPDNVIALKGIGDCSLALAYQYNTMGWTAEAVRCIQKGIQSVELALKKKVQYQALWKLLGDLCSIVANIAVFDLEGVTLFEAPPYHVVFVYLEKAEVSYRKCLDFHTQINGSTETEAEIWYDIGSSIYRRIVVLLQSKGQCSGLIHTESLFNSGTGDMLRSARAAFIRGIQLNPLHTLCWNGLGLTTENAEIRQACFIRSCNIDGSAAGYANLAATLLFRGEDTLSRYFCWVCLVQYRNK